MSIKEVEFVFKNLPTKKIAGTDGFTGEFSQTLKESLFYKLFSKTEKE